MDLFISAYCLSIVCYVHRRNAEIIIAGIKKFQKQKQCKAIQGFVQVIMSLFLYLLNMENPLSLQSCHEL